MTKLASVGDFCLNEGCPDYGKLQSDQQHNIKKAGKTQSGSQRYQWKACRQTFTETKGTIFYRHRVPAEEIIETLALLGEGSRISSLARARGHKEDTILDWLRAADSQAEAVETVLLADYRLQRGQLDALWAYVGNKGEKGDMSRPQKRGSSGERR